MACELLDMARFIYRMGIELKLNERSNCYVCYRFRKKILLICVLTYGADTCMNFKNTVRNHIWLMFVKSLPSTNLHSGPSVYFYFLEVLLLMLEAR